MDLPSVTCLINPRKRKSSTPPRDEESTMLPVSQLLKPTLHVEICTLSNDAAPSLRDKVREWLRGNYETLTIGHDIEGFDADEMISIEIADYTGPDQAFGFYHLQHLELDVQTYTLQPEQNSSTLPESVSESTSTRILDLPNTLLKYEWNSLVFDDALPSRLLRYMTRMVALMKQPTLNLATFNWNRLCLLHGPPGSGKSTLCRALAQKLSIRLSSTFPRAQLVEINTNALLSKYFSESGKQIGATFEAVRARARDPHTLVCVIMDEVETIAGRRRGLQQHDGGMAEGGDGLRATNQLLTALDRLRTLPNVLVLCTSNLLEAIDPAFLDRVDLAQLIPAPSPRAIYDILRSCLNELGRSGLIASPSSSGSALSSPRGLVETDTSAPLIPTFAEMTVCFAGGQTHSTPKRIWEVAQRCQGFSGRSLRRLPILGLAMYTWGGTCSVDEAVGALEEAVGQEVRANMGT